MVICLLIKKYINKTLVLDLDETLIHTEEEPIFKYDQTFTIKQNRENTKYYMSIRPGVSEFLGIFL